MFKYLIANYQETENAKNFLMAQPEHFEYFLLSGVILPSNGN